MKPTRVIQSVAGGMTVVWEGLPGGREAGAVQRWDRLSRQKEPVQVLRTEQVPQDLGTPRHWTSCGRAVARLPKPCRGSGES